MSIKGHFTGRILRGFDHYKLGKVDLTVGRIGGWNSYGMPFYDLMHDGKKVGELGNDFILKHLKKMKGRK
jgi:hypothetical protein